VGVPGDPRRRSRARGSSSKVFGAGVSVTLGPYNVGLQLLGGQRWDTPRGSAISPPTRMGGRRSQGQVEGQEPPVRQHLRPAGRPSTSRVVASAGASSQGRTACAWAPGPRCRRHRARADRGRRLADGRAGGSCDRSCGGHQRWGSVGRSDRSRRLRGTGLGAGA
jgi:hypothetical protein